MTRPTADIVADLIEQFRKALMVEHAHDWDMDTISEAAHIWVMLDLTNPN